MTQQFKFMVSVGFATLGVIFETVGAPMAARGVYVLAVAWPISTLR